MMSFTEWLKSEKRKKKEKYDEQRSSQTHGESGHVHQQREVAGSHSQVPQQTVHVFAVPEL
jgi:uncharacterized protein YhjY with autotransporter beta-barrel domain